ncbi:CDGP domain-containing protein [Mycobacterium shigaense]|uniref:CDGP domain-containing protein n=1 Tax=Mycobacterium shigaense TaxID=722731 RepID=UPI003B8A76D8
MESERLRRLRRVVRQASSPEESYCDKPIGPDGTWERCHQGPSYPVYGGPGVVETRTPPPECYPIDPTQATPLGQPPNHIDD